MQTCGRAGVMPAATGSTVLKRLAYLNRSGVLVKPLQYSQVKGSLDTLGEEAALQILQDLEQEGANVPDPIEYVKEAAARASGSQPFNPTSKKRKAGEDGNVATADENSIVAKRVRLLNNSGQLTQAIRYDRVKEALESVGVGQAMTILKGLEDVAEDVSDPTAYIRTAVRGAGGLVPEDDGMDEGEEDADMADMPSAPPARPGWQAVKGEAGGRSWVKGEAITEADKIERRIRWLNKNGGLSTPIEIDQVLPALDCIGFKQSMRVLHRVQENGSTAEDPNDFIKDLIARSGWIWTKPDVIDDDEKVAKRVAWMNLFGGLQQPIDYAEVADALDGLKVPHAMVLLRELEVQAHKVENPTEYIKRTVALAGEDDVQVPVVDEDSTVAQHVASLNEAGKLACPIDLAEVGEDLAKIGDEAAMALLAEVEGKGSSVKNPTGYLKFKLKAKLASMGASLEETVDDETKILKRIEWLNDYGGLLQDIDYNHVAKALNGLGLEHAMTLLKELEDKKGSVEDPNSFIIDAARSSGPRTPRAAPPRRAAAKPEPAAPAVAPTGATDIKTLAGFVGFLNKNSKLQRQVKFSEVASALDALGPQRALRVLQEMQEKGLGLDDPVTYIRAAALRSGGGKAGAAGTAAARRAVAAEAEDEGDDVAKITKRLQWLNQFGGLTRKIVVDEVVGALYCLGLPQSMAILRGLQEKGARAPNPTAYIKAAIQRANGLRVDPDELLAKEPQGAEDDGEAEEEGAIEEDDGAIEEFEEPEGEDAEEDEAGEEAVVDGYEGAEDGADGEQEYYAQAEEPAAAEEPHDAEAEAEAEEEVATPAKGKARSLLAKKQTPEAAAPEAKPASKPGEKRIVGGLTGWNNKLIPTRPAYGGTQKGAPVVKSEIVEEALEAKKDVEKPATPVKAALLPITPQEKLIQVREYAKKHGLELDQLCLKGLSRLPFFKAKDMIDDVLLGGRNRTGVSNPSRYLTIGVQKLVVGLGVEQGIAMELAVSLGVVLNNDALDELACIPRKESHAIIREIARNEDARSDPIRFIQAEVMKCRAQMDARPWGPGS